MKRIFLALIVLGLATGIQSCNNGDYKAEPQGNLPTPPGGNNGGGGGGNGITGGIMSAKIDGADWSASMGAVISSGPFFQIQGVKSSNQSAIQMGLSSNAAPGEYTIDGSTNLAIYSIGTSTIINCTSGKVTITSNDATKVVGTFEFTDGTVHITNGAFSVNK